MRDVEAERAASAQGRHAALLAARDLFYKGEIAREMARFATEVNQATEDIGARRLSTVLEAVLDEVSFEGGPRAVTIDAHLEKVWPWVAQLGQDKGGFYTYE